MILLVEDPVSLHQLGGQGRAASSSLWEGNYSSPSVVAQAVSLCSGWCERESPTMLIAHKTCHFTSKEYLRSSQFFDAMGNIYQLPKVPVCRLPVKVCSGFVREP